MLLLCFVLFYSCLWFQMLLLNVCCVLSFLFSFCPLWEGLCKDCFVNVLYYYHNYVFFKWRTTGGSRNNYYTEVIDCRNLYFTGVNVNFCIFTTKVQNSRYQPQWTKPPSSKVVIWLKEECWKTESLCQTKDG